MNQSTYDGGCDFNHSSSPQGFKNIHSNTILFLVRLTNRTKLQKKEQILTCCSEKNPTYGILCFFTFRGLPFPKKIEERDSSLFTVSY